MIRILLADDHDVVRRGLKALLQDTGWQICGEARSGREAVELAGELKPDIAIVDLMVSEPNGLDTTRQIRKASSSSGCTVGKRRSAGIPRSRVKNSQDHSSDSLLK